VWIILLRDRPILRLQIQLDSTLSYRQFSSKSFACLRKSISSSVLKTFLKPLLMRINSKFLKIVLDVNNKFLLFSFAAARVGVATAADQI